MLVVILQAQQVLASLELLTSIHIDIGEQDENGIILPDANISEQLAVYIQVNNNDMTSNIKVPNPDSPNEYTYFAPVKLYSNLNDFWQDKSEESALCAMTTPNYGVRLWSKETINPSTTYLIKYLTCPDSSIPTVEPTKAIKNIPNCKLTTNTTIKLESDSEERLESLDKIYLYASNNVRTNGIMKSINSLETEIPQCFPEFLSYKMIVGPFGGSGVDQSITTDQIMIQDIVSFSNEYEASGNKIEDEEAFYSCINYVPAGNIYIWYTLDKNPNVSSDSNKYVRDFTPLNTEHKRLWDERLKAYYIPDSMNIYFKNTNELLISEGEESDTPSAHIKVLKDYKIKVYYRGSINFSSVEAVLDKYQLKIGEDFNPFQIMSDIATDSTLYGIVKYVSIEHKIGDSYVPANIIKISEDQRFWFKDSYSSLIEYVKV